MMTNSSNDKTKVGLKTVNSPLLPKRKVTFRQRPLTCSFQSGKNERRDNQKSKTKDNESTTDTKSAKGTKSYSFPEVVEAVMQKPKIHYTDFYKNIRRSIAWRKRLEQPWMRGNEMQAFYKMWKFTSHPTPGTKLPKLVHRSESLPRNFKFPGELSLHEGKERKPQQDFGIFRDCCCAPRVRIKDFQDFH